MNAAFDEVLEGGRGEDGALVFEQSEPARPAVFVPFPGTLDPRVQSALIGAGISGLYGHQADVWEAARRGEHVCVSTGTASGKSLAFTLPVLEAVCERKSARALYIYPTKALAQDQARALRAYGLGLRPAVYDGDTPREQRHLVRRFANPILTNPDMLHVGVLPNHRRWADVLSNLTHVVIDEAHTYRGVFGSHVALVLRRLRRVCALYGCEPQFLLASATIANPAEACAALTGLGVRVVDRDGAPRAPRRVAFWDTPLLDEAEGTRGSALGEAAGLLAALTERGLRTICFVKSRKASELVFRFARESLISAGRDEVAERLAPYRAGYTAEERRRIEGDLVSGRLLGVVATEALELGVDVGLLDCALAIGFPGTVASLRQQWGRAGRRGEGLALLVPGADALDRYFINHPDALLGRANEAAILDPTNPEIRIGHLRAAAHEIPLTEADDDVLGAGALAQPRRWSRPASCCALLRAWPGGAPALPPGGSRCARARPTRSQSWRGALARCSACSSRSARSRPCTRVRSTCTGARRTWPRPSTWSIASRSSRRSRAPGTRNRAGRPTRASCTRWWVRSRAAASSSATATSRFATRSSPTSAGAFPRDAVSTRCHSTSRLGTSRRAPSGSCRRTS